MAKTSGLGVPKAFAVLLAVCLLVAGASPVAFAQAANKDTKRGSPKTALQEAERGHAEAARRAAQAAGDPVLVDLVTWIGLTRADGPVGYGDALAFLKTHAHWPQGDTIRRRVERGMPESLPPGDILAWFADNPPLTPEGLLRYGGALMDTGDAAKGRILIKRAWVEGLVGVVEERRFRGRHDTELEPADHVARLDHLLDRRLWEAANRQAALLGGGHSALVAARQALATDSPNADAAMHRVPDSLQSDPGLLLERAQWRRRKGRYQDVVELLGNHDALVARPAIWWSLRHWAARRALDEGDLSIAHRIAAGHGLARGGAFAEAEWLAGWIALRFLDEPVLARGHFERLAAGVNTPISQSRAAYWAGRAAEAAGDPASAEAWHGRAAGDPTTFYGQLAAARLSPTRFTPLPADPQPTAKQRTAFQREDLARAARLLFDHGNHGRAELFLRQAAANSGDPVGAQLAADMAHQHGQPGTALKIARHLWQRGTVLVGHLFPTIAVKGADAREMARVLGLIRQESAFNSDAVSQAGARGLMQLMPATAKEVARGLGLPYNPRRLTGDPQYNLALGRSYLNQQIGRFDGSLVMALAAYNAGPGSVRRWLETYGDPRQSDPTDLVDWIERIPYGETRNYVQRVIEGITVYTQILAPAQAPALAVAELAAARMNVQPKRAVAVTERPPPPTPASFTPTPASFAPMPSGERTIDAPLTPGTDRDPEPGCTGQGWPRFGDSERGTTWPDC